MECLLVDLKIVISSIEIWLLFYYSVYFLFRWLSSFEVLQSPGRCFSVSSPDWRDIGVCLPSIESISLHISVADCVGINRRILSRDSAHASRPSLASLCYPAAFPSPRLIMYSERNWNGISSEL